MAQVPADAIAGRATAIGRLLLRLGETPEVIAELAEALERGDATRFATVLEHALGRFDLPPDECHAYVQVLVLTVQPARFVWRCSSKSKTITKEQSDEIIGVVGPGAETDAVLKLLAKQNVIKCAWQMEDANQLLVVEKYVQGMCP